MTFEKGNKLWKHHIGRKRSEETKMKMSLASKGRPKSEEHKAKIVKFLKHGKGENSGPWIKDRTQLKKSDKRQSSADITWRNEVKKRDMECKLKNEECKGRLYAHHIFSWRDYPELRYIISNGITLCHFHHPLKREEEKRMRPIFQELIK